MSQTHHLQHRRFEMKYLVSEAITSEIREFVSGYLELDEFGANRANLSYPVHSLYLDSDDLKTCQASVNGTKNRFKLRLRYYDDRPESPVFCEIKARVDNCILKRRCGIHRRAAPAVVAGQLPEPEDFYSTEPRHLAALQRFTMLISQLNARPKAHNCYQREAWISSGDDSVRVTFDRDVMIEPCFRTCLAVTMHRPTRVFTEFVIFELKFTGRFPNWFNALVRRFNLNQCSSAKYAEGVLLLGDHRFHDGDHARAWEWPGEPRIIPMPEGTPEIVESTRARNAL